MICILLPIYAVFIGGASAVLGTFYMRSLPAFPLTAKWWQWGQRFETSHPNLFKAIWLCTDCFSGHLAWISFIVFAGSDIGFTWSISFQWLYSIALAAGSGILFSKIFNSGLDADKNKNQWN